MKFISALSLFKNNEISWKSLVFIINKPSYITVNANSLKCHFYTSVTFRCGHSGQTNSSRSRSMVSEEHDQIVFSGKTTSARTSETHTSGTLIFLPLHSSRDFTYLSALLFDEDPGNNGNVCVAAGIYYCRFSGWWKIVLHVLGEQVWWKRR